MSSKVKKIIIWGILVIILALVGLWVAYRLSAEKSLSLLSPKGGQVWRANETYQIAWRARNIGKVGIVLIKGAQGQDVQWIAEGVAARGGTHNWQIFVWKEPRQDYRLAVFEYPWREGNKIDYADGFFTILGPQFASCDGLAVEAEWPFVPSDFPDLRKVFITSKSFDGNLERLEGADRRCQEEAKDKELEGEWKAFLGDSQVFAKDRLNLTGIIVAAESSGDIPEGKTCHRLLGRNFDDFFQKLSDRVLLAQEKLTKDFLTGAQNLWLGRVSQDSQRECVPVFEARDYSFTTTCQNWTTGSRRVAGFPPPPGEQTEFPSCFTPEGAEVQATGLAGLGSGLVEREEEKFMNASLGKSCDSPQKLLCVQQ